VWLGHYVAFDTVWLVMASLVSTCNLSTVKDAITGKQVPNLTKEEYILALAM
jgi:hypothetical protein